MFPFGMRRGFRRGLLFYMRVIDEIISDSGQKLTCLEKDTDIFLRFDDTNTYKIEDYILQIAEICEPAEALKIIEHIHLFCDPYMAKYTAIIGVASAIIHKKLEKSKRKGRPKRNSMTYLMRDSNTGYTKIGKSINPSHRERTLQSEKPTIKMYKVTARDVERELHEKYGQKRVRGEWFNLSDGDIRDIVRNYGFKEYKECKKQ